jgi:hypothetical protein
MTSLRHIPVVALLLGVLLIAAQARASILFNYSSDSLPWQWGTMNGEPDLYGSQVDPPPSFAFSFFVPDSWLSATSPTTFTVPVQQASTDPVLFQNIDINPGAGGTMTVNPDGSVSAWNFSMLLTELPVPQDPIYDVFDRRVLLSSAYGSGTCNCDILNLRNTLFFYNGEYFEPLGPAEAFYSGGNSPAAWTTSMVSSVPEPSSVLMLLGGLSLLGWYGRRSRLAANVRASRIPLLNRYVAAAA